MAEGGVLVDLNDCSSSNIQGTLNLNDGETARETESNSLEKESYVVVEDGELLVGEQTTVSHSDNVLVDENYVDGVLKLLNKPKKNVSLKRRDPVNARPHLVEAKKDEEMDLQSESEILNSGVDINKMAECEEYLNGDDTASQVHSVVLKRDTNKTSRESRNSAGASGGVFSENYEPTFEEFDDENVTLTEVELEEESYEVEIIEKPQEAEIEEDFTDIDSYHILSLGGDDRNARKVIVFSACRMPPKTEIDHQKLFRYMNHTLDQYVENDYSVVYFHHGLNSKNKPSLSWVVQVYHELDRKYKKNLKALYLVHPTSFIKVLWNVLRPFISAKFGKKVMYVNRLSDLKEHLHLDQLDIPESVKKYDEQISARYKSKYPPAVFHTPLDIPLPKSQQFGVSLESILANTGEDIPLVVAKSIEFLQETALDVEGIFRRSGNVSVVKIYEERFNQGDFVEFEERDCHVAAVLLKKFLRELPEPLMTFELYNDYMRIHTLPEDQKITEVQRVVKSNLPKQNYLVLQYVMMFLVKVMDHSNRNKMNATNLAIVFGPNLIWAKSAAVSLSDMGPINSMTKLIIDNVIDIFQENTTP